MTNENLLAATNGVNRQTFAYLCTATEPKMNKGKGENSNPYLGRVLKITKGTVMLCSTYENRVNNNLAKEGKESDFKASYNRVGEHVEGSKCVLHNKDKGTYYLQYEWFRKVKKTVYYLLDGQTVWSAEEFKTACANWLPKETYYVNQGLENTVNILSVSAKNILKLTIKGEKYME